MDTKKKILLIDSTAYLLEYYRFLLDNTFGENNIMVIPFSSEQEAIRYATKTSHKTAPLCVITEFKHEDITEFNYAQHLRPHWPDCPIFMQTLVPIDDIGKYKKECDKNKVTLLDQSNAMKSTIIPWINEQLVGVLV